MTLDKAQSVSELWQLVEEINLREFPDHRLKPIVGGGQSIRPKFMFLFINPTHRNISSNPMWPGPRYPFIGTKPIWRVLNQADWLPDELLQQIEAEAQWSLEFTERVRAHLESQSVWLTNVVKWTGPDGSLPGTAKIKLFLPVLLREIEIVRPTYIVTFGLIPYVALTGQAMKLEQYYRDIAERGDLQSQPHDGLATEIVPCYFPVGRGNPKRAIEILKLARNLV